MIIETKKILQINYKIQCLWAHATTNMTCRHGKEMHVRIKLYLLRVNCVTKQNMLWKKSLTEIDYPAALSSNFLHNDLTHFCGKMNSLV